MIVERAVLMHVLIVIAANAKEWSASQVREWAVEVDLPEAVMKAVAGYRGSDLADMAESASSLQEDLGLNRFQTKRLQDALAELDFK